MSTPIPPDLPTTPTPEGGVLGGLTGLYQSIPISKNQDCLFFLRLYQDGVALTADICSEDDRINTLSEWFHRENPDVLRGTYWTSADQIWMELPDPYLHEEVHLLDLRGRFCTDSMALQKMDRYSHFPMSVSNPVTKYIRLDTEVTDPACHIASFYFGMTVPGTPGGGLDIVVHTDPGEVCTLTYFNPDESTPLAENLPATADDKGMCVWEIPLPADTHIGKGQAAVTVTEVTKIIEVDIVNK